MLRLAEFFYALKKCLLLKSQIVGTSSLFHVKNKVQYMYFDKICRDGKNDIIFWTLHYFCVRGVSL